MVIIIITYLLVIFQVSVMTKLVPSPDWFVGLDSLDLCSQGAFIENVTIEVSVQSVCHYRGECSVSLSLQR